MILGVALRAAVRRVDGLSRTARRADRRRLDPDRGARDLGAEEARRLDDPREQHRPDDRIGRRIGRRRRRLHHSRADLPDAQRPQLFQLHPDHDADVRRRHPRRADDGAAAPRADRQGTRRAALPRRARRAPKCWSPASAAASWPALVFGGLGVGALWKSLSWIFNLFRTEIGYSTAAHQPVPERHAERRHLAGIPGRRLRHRAAHRRNDVRRRRAVVAGAAAAAVDPRQLHHRAVPADSSELREQPGDRPAVPDLRDEPRPAVERLHPLHRRRRRARRRASSRWRARSRPSCRRHAAA